MVGFKDRVILLGSGKSGKDKRKLGRKFQNVLLCCVNHELVVNSSIISFGNTCAKDLTYFIESTEYNVIMNTLFNHPTSLRL